MKNLNRRESSFIDRYDKIVNISINEIEFIRRTYKWYVGIIGSIIIIVIAVVYFLISDRLSGYEEILDNKFSEILDTTKAKQKLMNKQFIEETNQSIKDLIAKNFSDKEILKTIKLVATEKVDSFSKYYLDVLVEKEITPKFNYITDELNNSDAKIQLIEFYLSKVSALNDDRFSFDKLIEMSKDKNHLYSNQAGQVVNAFISRYSLPKVPRRYGNFLVDDGPGFNWSFQKCYEVFFSYPREERLTILDNVFNIDRFTEDQKIKLALQALNFDESLTVVRKSSDFLISKFDLKYANLQILEIINALKQKGFN